MIGKFFRALKIIAANGGPIRSLAKLWRMDTLKPYPLVTLYDSAREEMRWPNSTLPGITRPNLVTTLAINNLASALSFNAEHVRKRSFLRFPGQDGVHVGTDSWGNKYYENYYYMIGRSRWVEYNARFKWDYDASQVTPEWYGWLHYKTDLLPCEDMAKCTLNCCCWAHSWLQPHQENLTGTDASYYPYSTVIPHINPWDGCTVSDRIAKCNECEGGNSEGGKM